MRSAGPRRALAAVRRGVVLALLALGSCGYSTGVRLPEGYQSVGVTVFENTGPEPRLERDLYESLSRQASRMLDAELLAPDRADLVIHGRIIDFRRLSGVLSSEFELQQTGVRIILSAWIEDRRLGATLGDALSFDQSVRYIVRVGEEQLGARREALEHISQELLLDLFTQVEYGHAAAGAEAEELIEPEPLVPRVGDDDEE